MERVGFEVFLQDSFSKGFESLGHNLEHTVKHIGGMLIEMFAVHELIEFGKESMEYAGHIREAQAQIQASLESTGNAAGVNTEQLAEWATELDEHSKFTKEAILSAQSVMLTFTKVTGEAQREAGEAAADLATKMHMDLAQATVQVGKALQDPIRGIMSLRREGVNFSKDQMEVIKHLVATGQAAKAQQLILKELHTEFGGSANAALMANPMLQMEKATDELKESIGSLLIDGFQKIVPYIREVVGWVKEFIDTGKKADWSPLKNAVKELIDPIRDIIKTIKDVMKEFGFAADGVSTFSLVIKGLAFSLKMAMIPIMYSIKAIQLFVHFIKEAIPVVFGLGAAVKQTFLGIGQLGRDIFGNLGDMIIGVFTLDMSKIKSGFHGLEGAFKDYGSNIGKAYREGYDKHAVGGGGEESTSAEEKMGEGGKKTGYGSGEIGAGPGKGTTTVTGARSTAVTINIKTLAEFHNIFNNMSKDMARKIMDQMTEAALSAANDFNIIGGGGT